MNIGILLVVAATLLFASFVMFILAMSKQDDKTDPSCEKAKKKKVGFWGILFLLFLLVLIFAAILDNKAENGQVVKVEYETEYIGMVEAEGIYSKDGLTIVSRDGQNIGVYPGSIVQDKTNPASEPAEQINVCIQKAKTTRGIQFLGIWFITSSDDTITTAVILS